MTILHVMSTLLASRLKMECKFLLYHFSLSVFSMYTYLLCSYKYQSNKEKMEYSNFATHSDKNKTCVVIWPACISFGTNKWLNANCSQSRTTTVVCQRPTGGACIPSDTSGTNVNNLSIILSMHYFFMCVYFFGLGRE